MWLGLIAIGACVGGSKSLHAAAPFFGWSIVSSVFTLGGIFTDVPFTVIGLTLAALAVPAGFLAYSRNSYLVPAGTSRIIILAMPLLILVSGMVGSQWDEFSNWLTTPKLLLEINAFPTQENAHRGGNLIANPFGWHFINYMASSIGGRFLENAGALTNVLILLTFSFVSIKLIRSGMGQGHNETNPSWKLCAIGVLFTTILNTTFAQKVVLTAYVDVSTAALTGLTTVIGWYMLGALSEGRRKEALQLALQVGLLMALLVNLKQSTVVMAVIVTGALVLAGLRDPKVRIFDLISLLPRMVIPAAIIYLAWRYYVSQELTGQEMHILPYSRWAIEYIPQILQQMLVVLSKKGAYLFLIVIVIGFGIRGMVRFETPFDQFAIIAATVILGHNAFLLFSYVTAFGKSDALRVASYWRYNMQLGMVGVAFSAYGTGILWQKYREQLQWSKNLSWLPIALIILTPFVFANKLRFDRFQPVPHYRAVGQDLSNLLTKRNTLLVADPQGSGESAVITRFELGGDEIYRSYLGAFHTIKKEEFKTYLTNKNFSHLLVHSQRPEWQEVFGVEMYDSHSYLLGARQNGRWEIIKVWQKP